MKHFYPYNGDFRCYSDYNVNKGKYEYGLQKRFNILGINFWVTINKKYVDDINNEPVFRIGCVNYRFFVIADLLNRYVKS